MEIVSLELWKIRKLPYKIELGQTLHDGESWKKLKLQKYCNLIRGCLKAVEEPGKLQSIISHVNELSILFHNHFPWQFDGSTPHIHISYFDTFYRETIFWEFLWAFNLTIIMARWFFMRKVLNYKVQNMSPWHSKWHILHLSIRVKINMHQAFQKMYTKKNLFTLIF